MTWRFFELSEFDCECGKCARSNAMRHDVISRLDDARADATRIVPGIRFKILSGYRCPLHRLTVKNPTSSHAAGLAMNIAAPNSAWYFAIVKSLMGRGFHRFGFNNGSIHVDADPNKPPRVAWTYYD